MNLRSLTVNLVKATICIVALWWVARGVDLDDVVASWTTANPLLLVCAVAIFTLTPVLQGIRLRRLLAPQGIAIGVGESIRLAFAGNFMNFAVPVGSTTGDVYKAAYLARRSDRSGNAVVTTFVDRAIGLATLLLTVSAIAMVAGPESPLAPLRGVLLLLCAGLAIGAAAIRWMPLDAHLWTRIPAHQRITTLVASARESVASTRVLVLAVVDTLGIQIAATASFLCAAIALGFELVPGDWLSFYAFFSGGEIVKAIPGPPQGLGTLEAAYGVFFQAWATPAAIVSAAVAIRAINLICALPGAAFAVGSASVLTSSASSSRRDRRPRMTPATMAAGTRSTTWYMTAGRQG